MQSVEVPEDSLQHYQQAARQRALRGMQAFLLGSVTKHVLQQPQSDVLVVV